MTNGTRHSLILRTPAFQLQQRTVASIPGATFGCLLALMPFLAFEDFSCNLRLDEARQKRLADFVWPHGIRTLRFGDCHSWRYTVYIEAWSRLLTDKDSKLQHLICRDTIHVHSSLPSPFIPVATLSHLDWQCSRRDLPTEHLDPFLRSVLAYAALEKLVIACQGQLPTMLSLVSDSLMHLDISTTRRFTLGSRLSNLRYLVLRIDSHDLRNDFLPHDIPQSLRFLKVVGTAKCLFDMCTELRCNEDWVTQTMAHLIVHCEALRHVWQQPPKMCDITKLAAHCVQIGVRLDITAGNTKLVDRGTLHAAIVTSCAGCTHGQPTSRPSQ